MQALWLKGIPKDQHEERIKDVKSYRVAFMALGELLDKLEEEIGDPDYDNPSWAYKQADHNGQNRMLRKVRKLLEITKDDHA